MNPKQEKQRTLQQNKAIHKYCFLVASALCEAGLDMKVLLTPEAEIPPSPYSVKEFLWKPFQHYQLGKVSTTELSTSEVTEIYDTVNRHLSQFGIAIPFPSMDEIANSQLGNP